MLRQNRKIYICGPSGSGKSTLAKTLAEKLGIPFVTTSAKILWKDYGISSHKELLELSHKDPEGCLRFQWDLLKLREDTLKDYNEFVTDRSPIDNWVYFLLQNSMYIPQNHCFMYQKACEKNFPKNGKLVYLNRPVNEPLENDGMRVDNIFYQFTTQTVFDQVIASSLINENLINKNPLGLELDLNHYNDNGNSNLFNTEEWDFDKKLSSILRWLEK